jgi:hypothetical protein
MPYKLCIQVIHTEKLSLRLPTLTALIEKLKGDSDLDVHVEFVKKHEVDDIDVKLINQYVKLENPNTQSVFDGLVKNLHVRQVSQCLKHYEAMTSFSQMDYEYLLVIEDDVLFSDTVVKELKEALTYLSNNKNVDVLALGCPTPKALAENKAANVKEVFRVIPTMDSYLMHKDNVQKVLSAFLPIRFSLNIQFSFLMHTDKLTMFMMTPNTFVNGSKYGVYISSIDQNNRLFMNQDYNTLIALNTKAPIAQEDLQAFNQLLGNAKFKEHPDFQYQFGVFLARIGQVEKAKAYFDAAYKVYNENDSVLSNESEFLLNYTRLFKFFQDV